MNISLHYSIKYFKIDNCFQSILNFSFFFFSVNASFFFYFQRNVQDSVQMPDITNIHFMIGNTGLAWRRLTATREGCHK